MNDLERISRAKASYEGVFLKSSTSSVKLLGNAFDGGIQGVYTKRGSNGLI